MLRASVIVTNFNTKKLLINCLSSLIHSLKISFEVIVVDNSSTDGSVDLVREFVRKRRASKIFSIIQNKRNLLYSKANNLGIKKAEGKFVVILNSDTKVEKNLLFDMAEFMENHPSCGLASCREIDEKGRTIETCHKFHSPLVSILETPIFFKLAKNLKLIKNFHYRGWDRKSTKKVDTVPGSFIVARREVLLKLKGFDEGLPLFYNDADLCRRAYILGYDTYHNGEKAIVHLKARTLNNLPLFEVFKKSYQDMVFYFRKHYGLLWAGVIFVICQINLLAISLKSRNRL